MKTFNESKWPSRLIPVTLTLEHVEQTNSKKWLLGLVVTKTQWQVAFRRAIATWNSVGSNFKFVEDPSGGCVDVLMVRSTEVEGLPSGTCLYSQNGNGCQAPSGEIRRAVVKVNKNHGFRMQEGLTLLYDDPETVALHELGHVLGLDHSSNPFSIMHLGDLGRWEAQRYLSRDDIRGVCELYGLVAQNNPGKPSKPLQSSIHRQMQVLGRMIHW